jgi:hypothetical protein
VIPASSGECLFDRSTVTVAISKLQLVLAPALWAVVWNTPGEFDIDTERLKLGHDCLNLGLVEVCTAAHPHEAASLRRSSAMATATVTTTDATMDSHTDQRATNKSNITIGKAAQRSTAQPTALSCTRVKRSKPIASERAEESGTSALVIREPSSLCHDGSLAPLR